MDVCGVVFDHCNSQTLENELYWCCLSDVTVSSPQTRYYKQDSSLGSAPCLSTYHYITSSYMWLNFPCLPSLFLYTASDQNSEAGKAWEQEVFNHIFSTNFHCVSTANNTGNRRTRNEAMACTVLWMKRIYLTVCVYPLSKSHKLTWSIYAWIHQRYQSRSI